MDSLNNWDLVRAFARRALERSTLAPLGEKDHDAGVTLRLVLFLIVVAWWAFQEALAGRVSVGTFTMLMSLALLISAHVNTLGDNLLGFFEHLGVLTDSLETITKPHDIVDAPNALPLHVTGGRVDVSDVTFNYPGGTPVFTHLNLAIASGEKVGVAGPSGAGKSTLLRLLRRQFPIQSGRIVIDGQDIAGATWDSLHEAFAEVPRTPSVFHRSVRDNIIYGRPTARTTNCLRPRSLPIATTSSARAKAATTPLSARRA